MSSTNRNSNQPSKARRVMDEQAKPGKSSKDMKGSKTRRQNNRQQPKKDSSSKRVNYDNARVDKVKEQIHEDASRKGNNDISLWNKNPELLRSAGSIPFASILGDINFSHNAVPGIMTIGYIPAFGVGEALTALNEAADQTYSNVVHANSRNYNYTAPDQMILSYAGMDFFSILASMIRAYGTIKTYDERNRYYADAMVQAQGFDPSDLRSNLSAMWFDLNNLIDRARQVWIPNVFPIMRRKFDLNSNIWTDAAGPRAQSYVFVQDRYFCYSETGFTTGSALIPVTGYYRNGNGDSGVASKSEFSPARFTYYWVEWYNTANDMLQRLIESEDRGIIYGDLLNAYGAESLYFVSPITADYRVEPVYNAEMLMEIENAVFVDRVFAATGLYQLEEDLYPCYNAYNDIDKTAGAYHGAPSETILNTHMAGQPTPEDVMIASRLQCARTTLTSKVFTHAATGYESNANGVTPKRDQTTLVINETGTELCVVCRQWLFTKGQEFEAIGERIANEANGTSTHMNGGKFGRLMSFDWHPFIYDLHFLPPATMAQDQVGLTYYTTYEAYGDYDNYVVMEPYMLRKLHNTATFSAWGVPMI